MSRSVSAPSSVTNTSPCWYGDIVPGSTLMYGSSFCSWTVRPRATSNRPIDAAAMPFPSEDTTPPVTKMKRVVPFEGASGMRLIPSDRVYLPQQRSSFYESGKGAELAVDGQCEDDGEGDQLAGGVEGVDQPEARYGADQVGADIAEHRALLEVVEADDEDRGGEWADDPQRCVRAEVGVSVPGDERQQRAEQQERLRRTARPQVEQVEEVGRQHQQRDCQQVLANALDVGRHLKREQSEGERADRLQRAGAELAGQERPSVAAPAARLAGEQVVDKAKQCNTERVRELGLYVPVERIELGDQHEACPKANDQHPSRDDRYPTRERKPHPAVVLPREALRLQVSQDGRRQQERRDERDERWEGVHSGTVAARADDGASGPPAAITAATAGAGRRQRSPSRRSCRARRRARRRPRRARSDRRDRRRWTARGP